ncbi:Crp/Fnr family transcriptional regulator [bacterium]|nr:Crp/Fnr family transcriptional regulator [bacterium]
MIDKSKQLTDFIKLFSLDQVFSPELMAHFKLEELSKGTKLCGLGEPLETFFLLVEGKLKIYTLQENGKKILIRFYRPLSIVGDLEYLSHYPPNAIVETQEASILISVPMEIIRNHTYDCPKFLRFVITQLSQKLYTYSNASAMNLVYPLENRIASYLWSLSKITDDKQLEEIRVSSLEEMANLLCTSYRHLNRVLCLLESKQIIARNRGKIRIIDFEKLNDLSVGLFE